MINTVNYGCYDNSAMNTLITQAEAATSRPRPGGLGQADKDIMKDAAIVPFMSQTFPTIASTRVGGAAERLHLPDGDVLAEHRRPDIANIWLAS